MQLHILFHLTYILGLLLVVWAVSLRLRDLTRSRTADYISLAFRSLSEIGNPGWTPHPNSALPPRDLTSTLALKLFSGEDQPFQVHLEFLRYPQVIQALFQRALVGPPVSLPHLQPAWG